MYQGKRKISDPERYNERRQENISYRNGAVDVSRFELEGIVDASQLAIQYFDISPKELLQKFEGSMLEKNDFAFTADEARELANAYRHIATRLMSHADEIEAVADID